MANQQYYFQVEVNGNLYVTNLTLPTSPTPTPYSGLWTDLEASDPDIFKSLMSEDPDSKLTAVIDIDENYTAPKLYYNYGNPPNDEADPLEFGGSRPPTW